MLRSHFFVPISGLYSVFDTGDWIGRISSWKGGLRVTFRWLFEIWGKAGKSKEQRNCSASYR